MGDSHLRRVVVGALVAGAMVFGTVMPAGAAEPIKRQTVVNQPGTSAPLELVGLSGTLAAGDYKLGFANNSPVAPHVLVVVTNLPASVDTIGEFRDLIVAVESGAEPEPPDSFVGAIFSKAGQDHQKQLDMTRTGLYGYFCPIQSPSGVPHYDLGFIGLFNVA